MAILYVWALSAIYYLFLGIVNNLILSYLCTQKNKLKVQYETYPIAYDAF